MLWGIVYPNPKETKTKKGGAKRHRRPAAEQGSAKPQVMLGGWKCSGVWQQRDTYGTHTRTRFRQQLRGGSGHVDSLGCRGGS